MRKWAIRALRHILTYSITFECLVQATAAENEANANHAITITEEQQLLRFYGGKVPLLTQQLGLPRKVALTALLFLKRFYLSRSVLDADPARFMLTCIYLACKVGCTAAYPCHPSACYLSSLFFLRCNMQVAIFVQAEESYISADDFCHAVQQDAATVLQNEVALLQGLRFDLVVGHVRQPMQLVHVSRAAAFLSQDCNWSCQFPLLELQVHQPLWALQGFFADFETWRSNTTKDVPMDLRTASAATVQQAHGAAKTLLTRAMLTDAPLIHPPGLLGLSAMQTGFAQVIKVSTA